MARRASVTKPLSVIMAPRRSSRKVRAERFGTAWARRVSQAQRGVGIGVSMGRNRRTSKTLQLRAFYKVRPLRGRGHPEWQQATKNLTPEGTDKAAETLNSSRIIEVIHDHFPGVTAITSRERLGKNRDHFRDIPYWCIR